MADVVGAQLRALGSAFQVLCITHLPQIAAYADTHFQIEKRVDGGPHADDASRGSTPSARVEEIAPMLGGADVTDAVRASAREMLAAASAASREGERRKRKRKAKAKVARRRSER